MNFDGSLIEVARIVKAQGLKGELRVYTLTQKPEDLERYKSFFVKADSGEIEELNVERIRTAPKYVAVKFHGIDHIDDVERLLKRPLFINSSQLPTLDEGEYFISDMIGMKVVTPDGEKLGILKDILEHTANHVYQVIDGDKEILIPAVKNFVKNIDIDNRIITIDLIEGLRYLE